MLLVGINFGTSPVKVSVVAASIQQIIATASYAGTEAGIISIHPGGVEKAPVIGGRIQNKPFLNAMYRKNITPQTDPLIVNRFI